MKQAPKLLGLFCILPALMCSAVGQADETYAMRLGWGPQDRVVIFHCDDAGMSHSSNLGAIESLENGLVTSVSTMMPCPWVPEFAEWLKKHPDTDNGLHLTLNAEFGNYRWHSISGIDSVPGLADESGYLWRSATDVLLHATPDEVDREIRAQFARAEHQGIPITHLDSHMGTLFMHGEYLEKYVALGIEKNVPIMVVGGHLHYVLKANPVAAAVAQGLVNKGIPERVWDADLPVIDDIVPAVPGETPEELVDNCIAILSELKPGITQIIVHCSRPTEEFADITASGPHRLAELQMVTNPELKAFIDNSGIMLTTWRELKRRRDAR
jgi:predicted glycoside hydrolase/deacetylase ChbG (UPF0249 family)